jgi:RNase P subunit RPR2
MGSEFDHSNSVKKVHPLKCEFCKRITPHAEDTVSDPESATVWHCLICGTERRPPEPGGSSPMAELPNCPSGDRSGISLENPEKKEAKELKNKEEVLA